MKNTTNRFACGFGLVLFVLLSAAWFVFENFSGEFSETEGRAAQIALFPGWIVDVMVSGSYHGGFGDWRDYVVMVFVSWTAWMIPVALVWWSFRQDRHQNEITRA